LDLSRPPYRVVLEEARRINRESFVSFKGNRYSVPYKYAGMECKVRIIENMLRVLVNGMVVAEHLVLTGSGQTSREQGAFQGIVIVGDER